MGAVIRLEADQVPAALNLADVRMRKAVAYGVLAGAHRARAVVVRRTPVDMGQLKGSWKVRPGAPEFAGMHTVLAELVNDAPHISMVELGSKPHAVSPQGWMAIYEWVRRHHRGGVLGGEGRMRRRPKAAPTAKISAFHGPDPVIEAVTNAIVWKIRKHGTKATMFVRDSVEACREVMVYELLRAIRAAESEIAADPGMVGSR